MHVFRFRNVLTAGVLAALLLPGTGRAQEVEVISKEIAVARDEAALRLELSDGRQLDVALRGGSVYIGDELEGSYAVGGELDVAWRELLGEAVALDDGPLSRMLVAWSPPSLLEGEALQLAEAIDGALEGALTAQVEPSTEAEESGPRIQFSFGDGDEGSLVRLLLTQADRLGILEEALSGLDESFTLHISENVDVEAGEEIVGTLVVIQGRVRIEGEVDGDVVVVDGDIELLPGSRVRGEIRLADARMVRNEGQVDGEVVDVLDEDRAERYQVRDELREQIRQELRSELRDEPRTHVRSRGSSFYNPFTAAAQGVGRVMKNLMAVLFLGLMGMGVMAFAGENVSTVAETARRAPGRSAMVGMAGAFLLLPVWILGAIALAVSIVGIPVMIAWVPLFPLAAVAAAVLGYLAVARNTGEWLADKDFKYTDWIRKSNPVYTMAGGLVGLWAFFIVANALSILPFMGFFRGLLGFVGGVVTFAAISIGFGAVLLTRGGRRPEYYPADDLDAAWEAAMDVEVEVDDVDGNGGREEADPNA